MRVKFTDSIDLRKIIIQYTTIPYNYIAKVRNKTKTHLDERDVFIFDNYSEMLKYFKGELNED